MALRVLEYIASKDPVTREQIVDAREVWDPQYEHHQHVDDLLIDLQDEKLINYNSSTKEFSLTKKGEKVSELLKKPKEEPHGAGTC